MRQPIQSLIIYSILHYITYDAVQRHRVEETALIFDGINIKIITDNSYLLPPLCPCPKITHVFEEILLCCPIVLKPLFD